MLQPPFYLPSKVLWVIRFHPIHRLFSRLRNHCTASLLVISWVFLALISSNLVTCVPTCKQKQRSGWDGRFKAGFPPAIKDQLGMMLYAALLQHYSQFVCHRCPLRGFIHRHNLLSASQNQCGLRCCLQWCFQHYLRGENIVKGTVIWEEAG